MRRQRRTKSRGLWIAILGPDGVGKSSVIEHIKAQLRGVFAGVTLFHFRPMLGRTRTAAPVTDPHRKQARGSLVSFCKLLYWLLDCWLGYLLTIRPSLGQSTLVIFDRYYPDLLVDPRRYRLPASSRRWAARLVAFAPQPDLYLLLDAPAELVQRRKCEVPLAESQRQRLAYFRLFQSMRDAPIIDARGTIDGVAQQVAARILSRLDLPSQPREVCAIAEL